jgi:23S rRNA (uracil1939-C5)-methyltransferase
VDTQLLVTSVNADGDGLATIDGRTVAIPATIPGERVAVRLHRARDGSMSGEVTSILVASPHRVTPPCRHFGLCGGCAWQHIEYGEQLRLKQRRVQELLSPRHIQVRPTLGTPSPDGGTPWGYRDKVHFVFGPGARGQSLVMGHHPRASRSVIPVQECPVHAEAGNRFAFGLRDALARAHISGSKPDGEDGIARHVVVRLSEGTGELLATLVVTENVKALRRVTADVEARVAPAEPGARPPRVGFHLNVHDRPGPFLFGRESRRLFGLAEVREQVAGVSYLVSPTAFFQTNVRAADVLVREVLDALSDSRLRCILDLYAGVGLFALPLAKAGRAVTAVEENRDAVASAATALRVNEIPEKSCRLIASRVEAAMDRLGSAGPSREGRGLKRSAEHAWDAVVLDPPRQGCPPRVLDWILRTLRPARIVYVSCNPEALARDLAYVPGTGYDFERVQPVDMFPHTAHIETVVVLARIAGSRQ